MNERRTFLQTLGILIGGGLFLFGRKARAKKLAVRLDSAKQLAQVDGWVILKIKEREILFVRDSPQTIRALDPICTHKRCTVAYAPKNKRLECPCHGSVYDLSGRVLKGPAPKSLTAYQAELVGDRIILTVS